MAVCCDAASQPDDPRSGEIERLEAEMLQLVRHLDQLELKFALLVHKAASGSFQRQY
jgi:hypothetical protein